MKRSGLLLGVAFALNTVTVAQAQELTPYQSQVLGGVKKMLAEYIQKQHAICDPIKSCDLERVDVLDETLKGWKNTPSYGKRDGGRNESDCRFYLDGADNHDGRRTGTRMLAKS